jgi:hypothetical protein
MLGLAVDLGRVYIVKNETQTFSDASALAAAMALNGNSFAPARQAALRSPQNKWNLGNSEFSASGPDSSVLIEFTRPLASDASKPDPRSWSAAPPEAAGFTFARVTASARVPLYILPVVGTSNGQTVRAASVAGQIPSRSFGGGLFPFSPIQHESAAAANPPFGLVVGKWYTLRYPSGAVSNDALCKGDQGDSAFLAAANSQPASERGYYEDPQPPMLGKAIVDGVFAIPVMFPGKLTMSCGVVSAALSALNERINFDTDRISTSYEQYQANRLDGKRIGNGFRLVGAPVNSGPAKGGGAREIAGFGGFFLSASPTQVYYSPGESSSWCAEYFGAWSKGPAGAGAGAAGVAYSPVLIQ